MLAIAALARFSYLLFNTAPAWGAELASYVGFAGELLGVFGMLGMARYSARLARRIPHDRLGRRARLVVNVWAIVMALSLMTSIVQAYANTGSYSDPLKNWWLLPLQAWLALIGLLVLICAIRVIVLLIWFSRRLRPVRQVAAKIGRDC